MKSLITRLELPPSVLLRKARKPLTLIAALGLVAWGAGVAHANDLFNGTLDQTAKGTLGSGGQNNPTPIGWWVDANKSVSGQQFDGASSEPWANVLDPDGYGLFFKPFQGTVGDEISVHIYQDLATTPGTKLTFSGYAKGEANYCGFFSTNTPAPETVFFIEWLDGSSNPISTNKYDLVANGLNGVFEQYTSPQWTAPAGAATARVGLAMNNAYGTGGGQALIVDAFDVTSVAPAGSPVITSQPGATTVAPGGSTSFSIGATGATGYQWQHSNTNLLNGGSVSGATTAPLTITGASVSDVGNYRVRVSNGSGALYSTTAPLALQSIAFYPTVILTGSIGSTYRVDYSTALAPATWIPVSTNLLTVQPQYTIDIGSPGSNTRFYRSVFLY
jgi:hypothetical protein